MTEPVVQVQDHDRRVGRLEGIAEQLTEQGRQTNSRFDSMERSIAGLRQETNARFDSMERAIRETNARIDSLVRWLVGVQVGSFLVMGGLLVSILLKLK